MSAVRQQVSSPTESLILVDDTDEQIGFRAKSECHQGNGLLHRAFSVFIFNREGKVLLQQRSEQKPSAVQSARQESRGRERGREQRERGEARSQEHPALAGDAPRRDVRAHHRRHRTTRVRASVNGLSTAGAPGGYRLARQPAHQRVGVAVERPQDGG